MGSVFELSATRGGYGFFGFSERWQKCIAQRFISAIANLLARHGQPLLTFCRRCLMPPVRGHRRAPHLVEGGSYSGSQQELQRFTPGHCRLFPEPGVGNSLSRRHIPQALGRKL